MERVSAPLGAPQRWHHIAVSVANASDAASWYCDKLGFAVALQLGMPGGAEVVFVEAGSLRIELIGVPGADDNPRKFGNFREAAALHGIAHASIVVEDCEAVAQELERRGVRVSRESPSIVDPELLAAIRRMTAAARWFWDLDGNLFQLCQEPVQT